MREIELMDNPNKDKTCFIITPIGEDRSEIRRAADGVIDAVIIPELEKIGFHRENVDVAHRMPNPGSINQQVIKKILESDLAIANLTTLNPNVMYELAIRHAVRKPVIQICQKGTNKLPFDITEERTIFYNDDMSGVIELGEDLRRMLPVALNDEEPDNPIYRVVKRQAIIQSIDANNEPLKYLFEQMSDIQNQVSELTSLINNSQDVPSRNNLTAVSGERERLSKFKIDDSKISHTDVMNRLKKFKEENMDIQLAYSITGDILTVAISASRAIMIDSVMNYILSMDGVSPIVINRRVLL
ncbi:hypothetical protein PDK09_05120 [Bacillus cereus]|nr:hypothetical protein [Bacillus cereus]MDA1766367.1 hypothetical protein [Bacillus cereus]